MNKAHYWGATIAAGAIIVSGFAGSASAAASRPETVLGENGMRGGGWGMMSRQPGIFGQVTAINGTAITVLGRANGTSTTQTSFAVDASGAAVDKNGSASSIAAIAVGDRVAIEGTLNGTTVVAKKIRDGVMMGRRGEGVEGRDREFANGTSTPLVAGNGQPIIGGTVSSVNGTSVVIANKSGVAYTIDVSAAKITKNGKAGTIADVAIGDSILAQGTINGTSAVAATLVDEGVRPTGGLAATSTAPTAPSRGFFGKIGGFFAHLFGF